MGISLHFIYTTNLYNCLTEKEYLSPSRRWINLNYMSGTEVLKNNSSNKLNKIYLKPEAWGPGMKKTGFLFMKWDKLILFQQKD